MCRYQNRAAAIGRRLAGRWAAFSMSIVVSIRLTHFPRPSRDLKGHQRRKKDRRNEERYHRGESQPGRSPLVEGFDDSHEGRPALHGLLLIKGQINPCRVSGTIMSLVFKKANHEERPFPPVCLAPVCRPVDNFKRGAPIQPRQPSRAQPTKRPMQIGRMPLAPGWRRNAFIVQGCDHPANG